MAAPASTRRFGGHLTRDDLPTAAGFAPGPRVSVASVTGTSIESARKNREHGHASDRPLDLDLPFLEVEPREPQPSRGVRGQIVPFANDDSVRPAKREIVVKEAIERRDIVRQHCRSQLLLSVSNFVRFQRLHARDRVLGDLGVR